jgi:hypothetical protein
MAGIKPLLAEPRVWGSRAAGIQARRFVDPGVRPSYGDLAHGRDFKGVGHGQRRFAGHGPRRCKNARGMDRLLRTADPKRERPGLYAIIYRLLRGGTGGFRRTFPRRRTRKSRPV